MVRIFSKGISRAISPQAITPPTGGLSAQLHREYAFRFPWVCKRAIHVSDPGLSGNRLFP